MNLVDYNETTGNEIDLRNYRYFPYILFLITCLVYTVRLSWLVVDLGTLSHSLDYVKGYFTSYYAIICIIH